MHVNQVWFVSSVKTFFFFLGGSDYNMWRGGGDQDIEILSDDVIKCLLEINSKNVTLYQYEKKLYIHLLH